ncbi:MAG: response regulator transcription factor [Chloroflexi bacterium]|nr:response regulator transcription factor [Chloroflexota bacterium]
MLNIWHRVNISTGSEKTAVANPTTILVVDDETHVRDMLKEWLEEDGYQVQVAASAAEALKLFFDFRPALTVVDLRMPGMDGFQLISRLRELSAAHILILSALSGDDAIVRGLDLGADEYLVKPVSQGPFLARVRSLLRRGVPEAEVTAGYADAELSIDMGTHAASVRGQKVHLSPLEFRLLAYLVKHRDRVITHDELINEVWGAEDGSLDSLKWYASSLRRKLEVDPDSPHLIINVRGLGYRYLPPGSS